MKTRTNVAVPSSVHERVKVVAAAKSISVKDATIEALEKWVLDNASVISRFHKSITAAESKKAA